MILKLLLPQMRRFLFILPLGVLGLIGSAFAQTSDAPDGPRFVQAGEENDHFQQVGTYGNGCDAIGFNLRFCPEGTDWTLERNPVVRETELYQSLYKLSEAQRTAFTVIFMPEAESFQLDNAQLTNLMTQHVFENGPRGPMVIETIIDDLKDLSGENLLQRTAIVTDRNADRYLLTVNRFKLRYGVGFHETTVLLPDGIDESQISQAQHSFHNEVMELVFIIAG